MIPEKGMMMSKLPLLSVSFFAILLIGCTQKSLRAQDTTGRHLNRLRDENSPYLLQHADNPVDWYPWGKQAFQKAREENKPIFLTIGYSTCYWCHVMEREDYMNKEIAAKMNKYFINVMVDREERPDIDRVYMTAVQAMTGSGGWPMSLFLTPGLKPFFGATYIPPTGQNGRPGFNTLLDQIHKLWISQPGQITDQADKITRYLKQNSTPELTP